MFMNTSPQGRGAAATPAKFAHWRAETSVVQDAAAYRTGWINLTEGDKPEQLRYSQVSAAYFRLFGAPIVQGRAFSPDEDRPNGGKVALISSGLLARRLGGDPNILGRTISLGGDPHVIIGVVGSTFDVREFGAQPDVWTAFQLDPNTSDQGHYFRAAARLKPGVSLDQAKARLQVSASEFRARFPDALEANEGFSVTPF